MITWKCTCLLSETELTGIHTLRGEAGWIYKANIVFCGERVFTHRNKYVLFPTFQMKKYMLLHRKCFANVRQKPKTKREALPLEREKNPHLLQPWLQKVQHQAHDLLLPAKEPNIYFCNKAITKIQSCFPKKFSSISRICLCSAKYPSVPHRALPLQPGQHLLVWGDKRRNRVFCDSALTAEAAQYVIRIDINFSFCLHTIYSCNS